ncbi:hypothetical protein Goklo_025234, partial [Gossypium klotzschianum]|nr:hypothetical protein [Gossypium klotzschianum]
MCPQYGAGGETSLHACRDCPFSLSVWLSLGFNWHVDESFLPLFWVMFEGWDAYSMCMVDGRTQPSEHGVMTLNHLGLLMRATYFWMEYVSTPLAAEAWVSLEEIWFAREMGFGSVEIEGDSLVVIMKLRFPRLDRSDISSYVLEAQSLNL